MTPRIPASLRVIGRSIVDWWDGWLDMVMVTIVWFIAQVTIVLGPPATFGYYYVAHQMQNGEALGVRGLVEGARKYFWKAWLWGLINLAVLITLYVNIGFYASIKAVWGLALEILILLLGYLWLCTQFYGLPYFMEQDVKSLRVALKNGVLTTLAAPLYTLILMIVSVIAAAASFIIILPVFLGLPGLIPVLGFHAVNDRLIAFGLRQREKTPKEIEVEQGGRIVVPQFDHDAASNAENKASVGGSAPDGQVVEDEGQIEQKE